MSVVTHRNTCPTPVAMCPVACPVAVPFTTMNTGGQGRNRASDRPNRDGTHPVFRGHDSICAAANPGSGGCHE